MYSTCFHCHASLGTNDAIERFPVGRRVAFDPASGRLWAVCASCGRWNLAPLEERWEAVEECERRFRGTRLRYSTGHVGLAWLPDGADLVRVGPALRPEVAAWRYGRVLARRRALPDRLTSALVRGASRALDLASGGLAPVPPEDGAAATRLLVRHRGGRVIDVLRLARGAAGGDVPVAVVRYRHLAGALLVRPELGRPWALVVSHDAGAATLGGDAGVRAAAKLLAAVNRVGTAGGVGGAVLARALGKLDESADAGSYFNRVLALALRYNWGQTTDPAPAAPGGVRALEGAHSDLERVALRLTGRTFWAHGGLGGDPQVRLLDVPLVDRLALEMAAHEDAERRALDGELAALEAAWRDAEEIAAIADTLVPEGPRAPPLAWPPAPA